MSNTYSLNDNVNDSFTFEVGGHQYKMTYPTLEQVEELQELVTDKVTKETDGETSHETTPMDWMYKFISPVDESAPSIQETMKKQNIRVIANFSNMVKTEFGLGQ